MALKDDPYSYHLKWSEEDGEYVATCMEFPGLSWLDENPRLAIKGILDTVEEVVNDMKTNNEPLPKPISKPETVTPLLDMEN